MDQCRAAELAERLDGVIGGKLVGLDYRMVFVWNMSKARQEAATLERHPAKVRAEFEAAQWTLGRYSLTTTAAVARRLEAARGKYPEGAPFTYQLERDWAGRGRHPVSGWRLSQN